MGGRIREARLAAGLTQGEVARRVGLDRTAVVRIEAGERAVSALEGVRLAEALEVSLIQLVSVAPQSVVARRPPLLDEADASSRQRYLLDADLERHARDTERLIGGGFLQVPEMSPVGPVPDEAAAREAAQAARALIRQPHEPLGPLADVAEHFGLYLTVVDRDADGASLLLDSGGVAVVGARAEPGRRRWTAAHELGHHLLRDAYHSDIGVSAAEQERERVIDAFASEFLLPQQELPRAWQRFQGTQDPRQPLMWLSATYRVSWSAAVGAVVRAGLIPAGRAPALRAHIPTRGDLLTVVDEEPTPDLPLGTVGARWRQAVLAAYTAGAITGARAVELLPGQTNFGEDDLPTLDLDGVDP